MTTRTRTPFGRGTLLPWITGAGVAAVIAAATVGTAGAVTGPTTVPAIGAATGPTATTPTFQFRATGKYAVDRRGTTSGTPWVVRSAPGTNGTRCWQIVVRGRTDTFAPNAPNGAHCIARPPSGGSAAERSDVVAHSTARRPISVTVLVAPTTATSVRVGSVGGSFRTVTGRTPFVFAGRRVPLYAEIRLPRGAKVVCTAGAITDQGDLEDPLLTNASIGTPWTCDTP